MINRGYNDDAINMQTSRIESGFETTNHMLDVVSNSLESGFGKLNKTLKERNWIEMLKDPDNYLIDVVSIDSDFERGLIGKHPRVLRKVIVRDKNIMRIERRPNFDPSGFGNVVAEHIIYKSNTKCGLKSKPYNVYEVIEK